METVLFFLTLESDKKFDLLKFFIDFFKNNYEHYKNVPLWEIFFTMNDRFHFEPIKNTFRSNIIGGFIKYDNYYEPGIDDQNPFIFMYLSFQEMSHYFFVDDWYNRFLKYYGSEEDSKFFYIF
jgi:hypothetical protein